MLTLLKPMLKKEMMKKMPILKRWVLF